MTSDLPKAAVVAADEAYFHERDKGDGFSAQAMAAARLAGYATVWQAGREPLLDLLEASRKLLAEIVDIAGDGGGLGSTVIGDARRLAAAIEADQA